MNSEVCLSLENVSLGYSQNERDISVLRNINMELHAGEFIGIAGLNGIGKSTLLKSISGLLPVLSGNIKLDGTSLTNYPLTELAKKISIVLTDKIGGFNLTTFDLVAAGQIPYTNSFFQLKEQHLNIINEAIDTCGLNLHRDKLLNELSDGLFQKTAIAKSLAQQTPVMLLDEPSAFLDYASKHELFLLLKKLTQQESKCILVSSHDLDLLVKYCSKLLIISEENIELINASEALSNKALIEIGGGYLSL